MCTYGIEILADNIAECRANMLEVFAEYLNLDETDDLYRAAFYVLSENLVHGDALTMRMHDDQPIAFAEWGYLARRKFQRRDFLLGFRSHRCLRFVREPSSPISASVRSSLPIKSYPPMTVARELALLVFGRWYEGIHMNGQASFTLRGRNPDVLTCIANLSNDEVFTPPEFANRMLDTLAETWAVNNGGTGYLGG